MSHTHDGGAAFPLPLGSETTAGNGGMSLRDYFAGQALIMIPHHGCGADLDVSDTAHAAYQFADAMLAHRNAQPDTTTAQQAGMGIGGGK